MMSRFMSAMRLPLATASPRPKRTPSKKTGIGGIGCSSRWRPAGGCQSLALPSMSKPTLFSLRCANICFGTSSREPWPPPLERQTTKSQYGSYIRREGEEQQSHSLG